MYLIFQINSILFHLPVDEWDTNDAYRISTENVKSINAVNVAAVERGVICSS